MTEERWNELAAAYALGALDADEKAAFEARLADDADLRSRVAEYESTLRQVAENLPGSGPPAELKSRMLARAREARPPSTPDIGRPTRAPLLPWALLAASIVGLAWAGVENRSLNERVAALSDELGEIGSTLAGAQTELARLDSLSQVLSGADVRLATLTGEAAPALRLVWNGERRLLLVAATNLPVPDAGRTYQLWGIRGDEAPVSLGTFVTGPEGTALVTLAPDVATDFDVSAVTEEPAGGSPQPTTQPFLVGEWRDA
jgi:anti-sigma-K factor RskA